MTRAELIFPSLIFAAVGGFSYSWYSLRVGQPRSWNADAIKAAYVSTQLREIDPTQARLVVSYELTNYADLDCRLADGPSLVVMSRLRSDHSLSSQEDIRLSYPTFLPTRQRARVALELRYPFAWPDDTDPGMEGKLKEFVNQRLAEIEGFVLFDQVDRYQIEFPNGWQELKVASAPIG